MLGGAARPARPLPQFHRQWSGRCSRVPAPAGIAQTPWRGGGESGRRCERARRSWLLSSRSCAGEIRPGCRPPTDGPATVASWSGARGGPGRRSQRRSGGRGPTPRGGGRRRERARPPYVSEDGVRSTPRVEGGVRRVHLITRSSADKGHLEAEASKARAAQPPAGRQTPAPPALRARLRPLGPVQRSSAHRLAVSPSRPSLSQTP